MHWVIVLLTAALFGVMILLLAAKPKYAAGVTGAFIALAAAGGFVFYGIGYAATQQSVPLAVVRALLSVCGMFVGKMDYSSISAAPMFACPGVQLLYWLVHLLALYATASAAIAAVGTRALKKLRLWLARWGELNVIFGVSDDSLELGKALLRKGKTVVFADESADGTESLQAVVRTDHDAVEGSRAFFRSIGVGRRSRRSITVYCMHPDPYRNELFARSVRSTLEELEIPPVGTRLVISGDRDTTGSDLQVMGETYGFGSVAVFQKAGLAARLLMQSYPPCSCLEFDENGLARGEIFAMVVGFGKMGQEVLRALVMNSQFEGSRFRAAVFAADLSSVSGEFFAAYGSMLREYEISFHQADARSEEMYRFLQEHGGEVNYVALCAGDRVNRELSEELGRYFRRLHRRVPLYQCSYNGVLNEESGKLLKLCDPELLSLEISDRMAMAVNQAYCGDNGRTALENWLECSYFSRMSSRASADFVPAMLRAAGVTAEEVLQGAWELTPLQRENLSKTEHLRWCAFHYSMGFSPMPREEFDRRAAQYRAELAAAGKSSVRVSRDLENRTHACLVSWEELDELSRRENAATGKNLDYKAMDTENVLQIPAFLRIAAGRDI